MDGDFEPQGELVSLHQQAIAYLEEGKFDEAIAKCQQVIQQQPEWVMAYKTLGLALQKSNRLEAAENAYKKAINLDPNLVAAYGNLGSLYAQQGRWEEAETTLKQAISIDPNFQGVYRNLARVLTQRGRPEEAQIYWKRGLQLDGILKQRGQEELQIGNTLAEAGKWSEAVSAFQKAIAYHPQLFLAHHKLGLGLMQLNQPAEAVSAFEKAIAIQPDFSWSHHHLGEAFQALNQPALAVSAFRKAIAINPDFCWSYYQLAKAATQLQQWEDVADAYQKAIQLKSDFLEFYLGLSKALFELKRWEDLVKLYPSILSQQPDFIKHYYSLAETLIEQECWDAALVIYETIIEHNPSFLESPNNRVNWGKILVNQNRYEQAISQYQILVNQNPASEWFYVYLADAYYQNQDWLKALENYQKAISINSNQDCFYGGLGNCLQKLGNFDQAIEAYRNAINIKNCTWYYEEIINVLMSQKKWEEALKVCFESLKNDPNHYQAYTQIKLNLKHLGRHEDAQRCNYLQLPHDLLSKFCNLPSPENWLVNSRNCSHVQTIEIYPSTSVNFKQPTTVSNNLLGFTSYRIQQLVGSVKIFPQARGLNTGLLNTIITANNQVVKDLSSDNSGIALAAHNLPEIIHLKGNIAFVSAYCGHNYFHWMVEVIPRLHLVLASGLPIDKIVVNKFGHKYEDETLAMFDIPENQKMFGCFRHIEADILMVPSRTLLTPKWACNFVKNLVLKQVYLVDDNFHNYSRKIYLSRANAYIRKVINEQELIDVLKPLGFEVVYLDNMSVKEQALCLHHAEVVISAHGAGLTNLVFCEAGTKVIELFPPATPFTCYWTMSEICELDYYYLVGEFEPESLNKIDDEMERNQNFYIDINSLLKTIEISDIADII
ncbi:MAG: tetratricopeptide repeat protein [Arthrospira sp. PLM2.Bin9]|nr:tetratricopeptide repeat protein [Arthrospira sp. PLM2.Bin9]TVU53450.1 MAG: tetratricopeptide repeat protein [Arthrospira sp. PLM2.Bin9]